MLLTYALPGQSPYSLSLLQWRRELHLFHMIAIDSKPTLLGAQECSIGIYHYYSYEEACREVNRWLIGPWAVGRSSLHAVVVVGTCVRAALHCTCTRYVYNGSETASTSRVT